MSVVDGPSASLRATGFLRYIGAAFLMVWLAGWVAGEVFALGFLVMLLRSALGPIAGAAWPIPGGEWIAGGAAGFVFLFLLLWLTLWTFGGIAAITELLRSLAGEDRVSVEASELQLVRRAGPFHRVRTFDRSRIRGVRMRRHDKAVVLDTASGTEMITKFGTVDERKTMTDWLRRRLSLPDDASRVDTQSPPPGWTMTIEGGTAHINRLAPRTRRIAAVITWAIAGLMGSIWYGSVTRDAPFGSPVALTLTLLVVSWAVWVTSSRREWLVRHGELTFEWRFAAWHSARSFKSARLEVLHSTDSDNDDHYKLTVGDQFGERKITSAINDEGDVVQMGRWLQARTGFPLTLPRTMRTPLATPVLEHEWK